MTKPRNKTISNVVDYLQKNGLSVYGPCADLDSGKLDYGNMDYDSEDVIKYLKRKSSKKGLSSPDDEQQ